MTKLYKLTDQNGQTRGGMQWGPGITHEATGDPSQDLCTDAWIHAYEHPLLAVLLNPIHGNFKNPRLFEGDNEIGKRKSQLLCGCRSFTTAREIPVPAVTTAQKVRFGILCAKQVYKHPKWNQWADAWLDGSDRSEKSAQVACAAARAAQADEVYAAWEARAADAAQVAAYAAVWAAADAAQAEYEARAAYAAVWAAADAVQAEYEARAADAAQAALAADAAVWAAAAAAYATDAAAAIDLIALAEQAVKEESHGTHY